MKITAIRLDDGRLSSVTAEMSATEAAFLAKLTGSQNGPSANEVVPGGAQANEQIYDCLTGDLFNRFHDDGVDGYLRGETE